MATSIYGHRACEKGYLLHTTDNCDLRVTGFKGGIVIIEPPLGVSIETFAHTIAGCFKTRSNFETEILRLYGDDTPFRCVEFEFGGAKVLVTKENATIPAICAKWHDEMETNARKYRNKIE